MMWVALPYDGQHVPPALFRGLAWYSPLASIAASSSCATVWHRALRLRCRDIADEGGSIVGRQLQVSLAVTAR